MKNNRGKKRIIFGAFLIAFIIIDSYGQEKPAVQQVKGPEASAIQKVIDVPVSMYSGIPNVSIPLYNISIKGVTVPISLSYTGGGIRVDEEATMVGLGWKLNYGGAISRTVKGRPDEYAFFEKQSLADFFQLPSSDVDPREVARTTYIHDTKDLDDHMFDLTPDEFFYTAGQYSGKYMYKQSESRFVLFPHEDVKLNYNKNTPAAGWRIANWDMLLPDGTKYSFGNDGVSSSQALPINNAPPKLSNLLIDNTWLVKKITSTNGESINYSYQQVQYRTYPRSTNEIYTMPTQTLSLLHPSIYTDCYEPIIQSIGFPNGNISFSLSNRIDLPSKKIDQMVITNISGEVIRKIRFVYDYFYGNYGYVPIAYRLGTTDDLDNKRLKLNAVIISDSTGTITQQYNFDYYTGDGRLPSKYSFAQDVWGYFNGTANTTWVPKLFAEMPFSTDRKVNNAVNNVFALKSVTYPTGGKTVFTYESNVAKTAGYTTFDNMLNGTNYVDDHATLIIGNQPPSLVEGGENIYYSTFTIPSNGGYPANNGFYANFGASISVTSPTCVTDYAIFTLEEVTAPGQYQQVATYKMCNNQNPPVNTQTLPQLTAGATYRLMIRTNFPAIYTQNGSLSGVSLTVSWRNYIPNANGFMTVGGLRVRKIQYLTDSNTLVRTISYTYLGDDSLTSGSIYSIPYYIQYASEYDDSGDFAAALLKVYGAPLVPFQSIAGGYVGYTNVQERTVGTANPSDDLVTKYTYSFIQPIYQAYASPSVYLDGLVEPHEWQYGKLQRKEYLRQGQTIRTEDYSYASTPVPSEDYVDEIMTDHISWSAVNNVGKLGIVPSQPDFTDDYILTEANNQLPRALFNMTDTKMIYGVAVKDGGFEGVVNPSFAQLKLPYKKHYTALDRLLSKTTTIYDGPTPLVQTENYYYDKTPTHYQLTRTESTNSKNQLQSQRLSYPSDFPGDPIYTKMVQLNMKAQVVKREDYRGGNFVQSQTANYFDWGNNLLLPKTFETVTLDHPSDLRGQFDAYDSVGNYLSLSNTSSPPTCYVYSYNGQYVIAQISNANYATVQSILGGAAAVANFSKSSPTDVQVKQFVDALRNSPLLKNALVSSYTYKPLVGITSMIDPRGIKTTYEYDGLQRLLRIRDMDGNIIKQFDYQYQTATNCGSNCSILAMTTLSGTNTIGYPVGVFNANGKLLGNATNQSQYISLWNTDTANAHRGTLAAGADPLHFQFTLIPGKTIPAITGCRYFQYDLAWNNINAIRNSNGAYINFGDGTGMRLGAKESDSLTVLAPNTTQAQAAHPEWNGYAWYFVHTYPDNSVKTLTFYHNDASEGSALDNNGYPATSLTYLRNLRGNLPQYMQNLGGGSYQDSSALTVAGITNWNTIHSIKGWGHGSGDAGVTPTMHVGYPQDFMAGNRDLESIGLCFPNYIGCFDSTFRISRLKSDWNTYFTHLKSLFISDAHWNREDLSALKELNSIYILPARQKYTNDPTNNPQLPIPAAVIDNIYIQVAAGAGQTVTNGVLTLYTAGTTRTSASDAAVSALLAKGWTLNLNGVQLH